MNIYIQSKLGSGLGFIIEKIVVPHRRIEEAIVISKQKVVSVNEFKMDAVIWFFYKSLKGG